MRPIIEFCANNMHHGTDELFEQFEEDPEYDVIEYGCLGNCGLCFATPYAMVNGDVITGETIEELTANIHTKIKQLDEMESIFDLLDDDDDDEDDDDF